MADKVISTHTTSTAWSTSTTAWFLWQNGDSTYYKDQLKSIIDMLCPVGSIKMYGSTTAPSGWLNCDGSTYSKTTYANLYAVISTTFGGNSTSDFRVPDFRGIFPRGVGTSTTLFNASTTGFSGTLGTYQNDKMQGWQLGATEDTTGSKNYYGGIEQRDYTASASIASNYSPLRMGSTYQGSSRMLKSVADGTNGTPRTGTETNPANLGINFIIKY